MFHRTKTMKMIQKARIWRSISLELLNDRFESLGFEDRIRQLYRYFDESEILFTSSFGTKSAFLLYLISKIRPSQKVHFINTGFHFPETLAYRDALVKRFKLKVVEVRPDPIDHKMTEEGTWWKEHSNMCCNWNKVRPLEPIKARHKIWISGLMANQTNFRSDLRVFEQQGDIIKFHPIIDISEGDLLYWKSFFKLPSHPLEALGYDSIGCSHCTTVGRGREGRWKGKEKTECGLHPDFFLNRTD